MARVNRGTKRTCNKCGARFYDLGQVPPTCPVCLKAKDRIRELVISRGIKKLYHFTRVENVPTIVQYGIVPTSELQRKKINSIFNDPYRHDHFLDASSFSISFPNYLLFFTFRKKETPEKRWAVLELPADLLWFHSCLFSPVNAASKSAQRISIRERETAEALAEMFRDSEELREGKSLSVNRNSLNIPSYFPTNPQAEVLIFGIVSPNSIQAIAFDNGDDLESCKSQLGSQADHVRLEVNNYLFKARKDYRAWQEVGPSDQVIKPRKMDGEIPF